MVAYEMPFQKKQEHFQKEIFPRYWNCRGKTEKIHQFIELIFCDSRKIHSYGISISHENFSLIIQSNTEEKFILMLCPNYAVTKLEESTGWQLVHCQILVLKTLF